MYSDLKSILALGDACCAAIPAFNVYNMESVLGVMLAAKETHAPVIFQVYSRLFDTGLANFVGAVVKEAIYQLDVPAVFHLDHGAGIPEILRALRLGATGVMLDKSTLPLEENIAVTREAVQIAGDCGAPLEGELGHVGSVSDTTFDAFTDVNDAERFVAETKVAALAVMVGTAHGRYKKAPKLDIKRIEAIRERTKIPIVLHGGTGIPDDQVRMAIKAGVRKVNFGTDLCYAFLDCVRAVDPGVIAIDLFMKEPVQAVKKYAIEKIRLLGADRIL